MRFYGTKGRIEAEIPFNPTPGGSSRVLMDDGRDLTGGGQAIEVLPPCDQYTIQGDLFSRAIRDGGRSRCAGGRGKDDGRDRRGVLAAESAARSVRRMCCAPRVRSAAVLRRWNRQAEARPTNASKLLQLAEPLG